jgi:hypothetical protein
MHRLVILHQVLVLLVLMVLVLPVIGMSYKNFDSRILV